MDDQLQELGDFGLKLLFRHIAFNLRQNKDRMGKEPTWRRKDRGSALGAGFGAGLYRN